MKLWIKTYFITLVLSLVLINSGIYLVFYMTYHKDLKVEQVQARSTFNILEQSFERNMNVLLKKNILTTKQLKALLSLYERYYKVQKVSLKLWQNQKQIYPDEKMNLDVSIFQKDKSVLSVDMRHGVKMLVITKVIEIDEQIYYFYYEQPLKELAQTWNRLQRDYLLMSFGMSVLLAVMLYMVLKRLNKPMDELGIAVDRMKSGNYSKSSHIKVKGHDDIAKLQQSFNEMADIIEQNMECIKQEAYKRQKFVDNFAHELKSPLTSIYGFAEYVSKANIFEEEKKECMDFIMEESNRMLHLSYTLLDMARLREEQLTMEQIDVREIEKNIQSQLKHKVLEKNIKFYFCKKIEMIYGNKQLLNSLLYNLICNAINACGDEGKIQLQIEKNIGEEYCIKVRDNGCGMEQEHLEHITEPFYRIDKARSRENGGTGLGLSLCRQIVKIHNGKIVFTSEKDKGTEVMVIIPYKKA